MDGTKQFANIYLDFLIIEMKNVIKLNFFAPFLCIFLCFFLSLSHLRVERSACKNLREQKPLLAEKAKKKFWFWIDLFVFGPVLCTTGPQPGTFQAQYSPLDLNSQMKKNFQIKC
jgi:hypothetical protein